jgi:hypothetical protein
MEPDIIDITEQMRTLCKAASFEDVEVLKGWLAEPQEKPFNFRGYVVRIDTYDKVKKIR